MPPVTSKSEYSRPLLIKVNNIQTVIEYVLKLFV